MRRLVLFVLFIWLLVACGGATKTSARLNGTWEGTTALGDTITFAIDFNKGSFEALALGRTTTSKLELVSELGNSVVFKLDTSDEPITATLQGDDQLTMTSGTEAPFNFRRVK